MKSIISIASTVLLPLMGLISKSMASPAPAAAWNGSHEVMDFNNHDGNLFEKSDWANGDMFNCVWTPNNDSFENGKLKLTIDRNGSGYTCGEYRTKRYYGFGMYQVNMKPIKNPGVVSSFFTYTGPSDGTKWDEIDIEFLGYDTTKVQFNYYTNGVGNHEHIHYLGFDASQGFHTYGFYWARDSITWYVDGKAVYTAYSNIPDTPGKIMMNAWCGTGVDDWLRSYDGRTPISAYYDWASYDAPKN